MDFTMYELSTVLNGLRVAAERFRDHAKELKSMPAGYAAIAGQFTRQAEESERLADRIQELVGL